MQNKTMLMNVGFIVIGLFVGWLLWGNCGIGGYKNKAGGMHRMPDGSMMHNMPMDMDSMMIGMMANLEGKTGDEFDKAFLSDMIVHHQGAVDMAKAVLTSSSRPEMIKLANDIISAQEKEISMMKSWQANWFK